MKWYEYFQLTGILIAGSVAVFAVTAILVLAAIALISQGDIGAVEWED